MCAPLNILLGSKKFELMLIENECLLCHYMNENLKEWLKNFRKVIEISLNVFEGLWKVLDTSGLHQNPK